MEKEFPKVAYVVHDHNGKLYIFTEFDNCPVHYEKGITIGIYRLEEIGTLNHKIEYKPIEY